MSPDPVSPDPATFHLFLPSGKTFTFQLALIVADTEHHLVVTYVAGSDGKLKRLTVQKAMVVAWSLEVPE